MGIAMVAMLAFGATFAYFTATANQHTANVKTAVIKLTSGTTQNVTTQNAVYGTKVLDAVSYDATGTTAKSYIFITLKASVTKSTNEAVETEDVLFADLFGKELSVANTEWTKLEVEGLDDDTTVYYQVYDPTSTSAYKAGFLDDLTITASPNYDESTGKMPKTMDCSIALTVSGKAVQAFKGYNTTSGEAEDFTAAEAYATFNG